MISKFRHSGIVVNSLKKSEHFYCKLLNFKVLQKLVEEGPYWNKLIGDKNTKANIIKAKLPDNVVLELTEFQGFKKKLMKPKKYREVGTIHLCFTVNKYYFSQFRLYINALQSNFHFLGFLKTKLFCTGLFLLAKW